MHRQSVAGLLVGLLMVACRAPTEVKLEISTDAKCADVTGTTITTGQLVQLEDRPPTTETQSCANETGRIGSLVIIPARKKDGEFAVRVVTGFYKEPEQCVEDGYTGGCIVARRALSFIPHDRIELPILMEAACIDVPCEATQTCRNGKCVSAQLDDPLRCTDPAGCDDEVSGVGGRGGEGGVIGGTSGGGAGGLGDAGGDAGMAGGQMSIGGSAGLGGAFETGGTIATGGMTTGGVISSGGVIGGASGGGAGGLGDAGGDAGMAGGQMSSGGAAGAGGAFETGGTVATGGVEAGGSAGAMNSAGTGTVDSVDATEVTRSAYEAWLATSPSLGDQVAECVGNSSFTPSCDWPPGSLPEHPVVCVDWCDANAYCLAQGRRLCGNVNGGAIAFTDYDNPTLSQWFRACSSGGQFSYPYGNTYSGTTCNGSAAGYATTVAVGTLSACQSPDATFSGVYDLSGNVYEWIDSCRTSDDACRFAGGSYDSGRSALTCGVDTYALRGFQSVDVGFRCCAEP